MKQIRATIENTVYAIGTDDDIYLSHGTPGLGWFNTGLKAKQISAGIDSTGKPDVFAIGLDDALYVNHSSVGDPTIVSRPSRCRSRGQSYPHVSAKDLTFFAPPCSICPRVAIRLVAISS